MTDIETSNATWGGFEGGTGVGIGLRERGAKSANCGLAGS
jgi:hypothetical protein